MVCARYPAIADTYRELTISVTAPAGTLHEAFFDPVAIGSAVGADATNGVLKPAAFTVGGARATISSLKWESGTATMTLNPSASLAGHAVDFIALDGSVSLTLSFDDATQSGGTLTWSVGEPALAGRRPAHAAHPVRQRDHPAADGHADANANGGAHRYTDRLHRPRPRHPRPRRPRHADAYAHATRRLRLRRPSRSP